MTDRRGAWRWTTLGLCILALASSTSESDARQGMGEGVRLPLPAFRVAVSVTEQAQELLDRLGDTIVVSEAPTAATKPSSVGMRLF